MTRIATVFVAGTLVAGLASAAATPPPAPAQSSPAAGAPASTARKLTRAEFDALRANPSRLLVIDVRRPDELTSIGGFPAYLSIQAAELEKSLAWIPKDRTIVTVSNHAARASRAADLLDQERVQRRRRARRAGLRVRRWHAGEGGAAVTGRGARRSALIANRRTVGFPCTPRSTPQCQPLPRSCHASRPGSIWTAATMSNGTSMTSRPSS